MGKGIGSGRGEPWCFHCPARTMCTCAFHRLHLGGEGGGCVGLVWLRKETKEELFLEGSLLWECVCLFVVFDGEDVGVCVGGSGETMEQ